jgi:hypothetical protein
MIDQERSHDGNLGYELLGMSQRESESILVGKV